MILVPWCGLDSLVRVRLFFWTYFVALGAPKKYVLKGQGIHADLIERSGVLQTREKSFEIFTGYMQTYNELARGEAHIKDLSPKETSSLMNSYDVNKGTITAPANYQDPKDTNKVALVCCDISQLWSCCPWRQQHQQQQPVFPGRRWIISCHNRWPNLALYGRKKNSSAPKIYSISVMLAKRNIPNPETVAVMEEAYKRDTRTGSKTTWDPSKNQRPSVPC